MVAKQVTAQWVMEARHLTLAADVRREDIVQPVEAAEAESEASIVPPPIKPNVVPTAAEPSAVVPTTAELPSSLPAATSANTTEGPQ